MNVLDLTYTLQKAETGIDDEVVIAVEQRSGRIDFYDIDSLSFGGGRFPVTINVSDRDYITSEND